jgi:hypothetical protein
MARMSIMVAVVSPNSKYNSIIATCLALFITLNKRADHLALMEISSVGFEVLTAVSTKMAVFWVVAPCSLVEVYQCFRGPCCLHHQGDE